MSVIIENRVIYINKCIPDNLCIETVYRIENEKIFKLCNFGETVNLNYRNSSEVKIEDKKITDSFWDYIQKYTPKTYDGYKLVGPDFKRVYLLRYFKGQFFKKHYDGFSEDGNGNRSKLTAMVYLNTMNVDTGGATRFYAEPCKNVILTNLNSTMDILPEIGKLVIFDHRILHEGMPILDGYKYCIRFNILYTNSLEYENPKPNGLKYKEAKMILYDKTEVLLTASQNNKKSKDRWFEVSMRPHVFQIEKCFPGFVDTTMGRPPTWEEDYCPNCYEILPIRNNYINCSGCCTPITCVNNVQKEENLKFL